MQVIENVTVDPQTLIGWNAVPALEKEKILEVLTQLAGQSSDQRLPEMVRRLQSEEPLYMLKAGNGLLVIFRWTEKEGITILDLVLQETIERYFLPKH